MDKFKKYRSDTGYSYTLGLSPTVELLAAMPRQVLCVCVSERYVQRDEDLNIFERCEALGVRCERDERTVGRLADKENVYVIGIFEKYQSALDPALPHAALVCPGDMGNLGTIMRTACGFDYLDLALIEPAADHFHPKAVRASMGALFGMRVARFASFDEYLAAFPGRAIYPFMLDGRFELHELAAPVQAAHTLVFGNEATGLDGGFHAYGSSVRIAHSDRIDSLNLSVAFGVAACHFHALSGKRHNPRSG